MTKPAKEIEKDFLMLRDAIVTAYYGRQAENWGEVNNALSMFDRKSPDLVQKLRAMDVPTEYPKDVITYLELSKLLNERDGVRYNADGEQDVYRTRWDPAQGKNVADRFSNIKATIDDRRVNSGYYKDRELAAYDKGTKNVLNAQNKRDVNELQPEDGKQRKLEDTLQSLNAELAALPETPENLDKLYELQNRLAELTGTKT